MLLIAGSAIALVFGWVSANESLIWTSIAGSFGAAISLALAFFRSRVEAAALARRSAAGGAPPTRRSATAADTEAGVDVVAIRSSKRYHRPECRYASAKGAETMPKAAARKEGFQPCGICKP